MFKPIWVACCGLAIVMAASALAAENSDNGVQRPSATQAPLTSTPTLSDVAKLQSTVADLQKTVKTLQNSLETLQTQFAHHYHTTDIGCQGRTTITPVTPNVPLLVHFDAPACAPDQAPSGLPLQQQ